MRIAGLRAERFPGRERLSASVVWEDADRPPFALWFDRPDFPGLETDLHPFLLAAILPAWRRGERRVAVEGAVCPRLRDGLEAAVRLLGQWWPNGRPAPRIEPRDGFRPFPGQPDRAALFLTGGVDSMQMLDANRRFYPAAHPAAYRDALYVGHMSFLEYEHERTPRTLDLTARQLRTVHAIAQACGLELIELGSNFRLLEPENYLALPQDWGILLAASAHLLVRRIGSAAVAASHDTAFLPPWGTHPLIDPLYASTAIEMQHRTLGSGRFEKVAEIARWDVALRHLFVCFEGPVAPGRLNCGRCEKCLRTMTALLAVGALERCEAFSGDRVTPEAIEGMPYGEIRFFEWLWTPMLDPLRRRGEHAVAGALERKLAAARRVRAWLDETDWKGRLRRVDRRLFGGAVARISRTLRGLPQSPPPRRA